MVNGYKEGIVQDLWTKKRPMSFKELSYDIAYIEIDRFRTKLNELIRDGYVYKRDGKYGLTRKAIDGIIENGCD